MTQKELKEHLVRILNGDWQARNKLIYYFTLDERLCTPKEKLDPEKETLKKICFAEISKAAAAKRPNQFAVAFLGFLYANGIGIERNKKKANKLYRIAEEQQNPWALDWRGERYSRRAERAQYEEEKEEYKRVAKNYYKLAAQQGFAPAQFNLSKVYGEERRVKEEEEWLKLALAQNEPRALNASSIKYGKGNPFDLYIPTNKGIYCVCKNERQIIKQDDKVSYTINHYKITVYYTAPNSNQKITIHEDTIPDTSIQDSKKGLSLAKYDKISVMQAICCPPLLIACFCDPELLRNKQDGDRIGEILSAVSFESALAKIIEEAEKKITDQLIRIAQLNALSLTISSLVNTVVGTQAKDTEVKITAEKNSIEQNSIPSSRPPLLFGFKDEEKTEKAADQQEGLVLLPGAIQEFESHSTSSQRVSSLRTTVFN